MSDIPDVPDPTGLQKVLGLLGGISFVVMALSQGLPFYEPHWLWGAMLALFAGVCAGLGGIVLLFVKIRYGDEGPP